MTKKPGSTKIDLVAMPGLSADTESRLEDMLAHMQTETHRLAADATFALSGEALGNLALRHVKKNGKDSL